MLPLWRRVHTVAISGNDQSKIHEATNNNLEVFEHVADIFCRYRPLTSGFALVNSEPSLDEYALVLGKPLGLLGEVGPVDEVSARHRWIVYMLVYLQQKEEEKGHNNGQESLENKDPAPSVYGNGIF